MTTDVCNETTELSEGVDKGMTDMNEGVEKGMTELLKYETDRYSGVTVYSTHQDGLTDEEFEQRLIASLDHWKISKVRGAVIRVNIEHSRLIPICVKHDFVFHHAKTSYVQLNRWLPEGEANLIPEYANHYLGVAGFVVNDKNQVLVIREKYTHDGKHPWKLPGGSADKGEELSETAVREVLEETGIETEFVSVICFRHLHKFRFQCSDFYFVCLLRPLTSDVTPCEREIAECRWLDIDDYYEKCDISEVNKYIVDCYRKNQKEGLCIQQKPISNYYRTGYNLVYSCESMKEDENS